MIQYKSLGSPLVTTEDAIKAKSFYTNPAPQKIQVGDAASKLAALMQWSCLPVGHMHVHHCDNPAPPPELVIVAI